MKVVKRNVCLVLFIIFSFSALGKVLEKEIELNKSKVNIDLGDVTDMPSDVLIANLSLSQVSFTPRTVWLSISYVAPKRECFSKSSYIAYEADSLCEWRRDSNRCDVFPGQPSCQCNETYIDYFCTDYRHNLNKKETRRINYKLVFKKKVAHVRKLKLSIKKQHIKTEKIQSPPRALRSGVLFLVKNSQIKMSPKFNKGDFSKLRIRRGKVILH